MAVGHCSPSQITLDDLKLPVIAVSIRNLDGPIFVDSSGSAAVQIAASASWRGTRGHLQFAENATSDGIVVCTLYSSDARCGVNGYRPSRHGITVWAPFGGRNYARVSYVVRVPRGVQVDVSTVNGELAVANVDGAVEARTVNGSVKIAARGGAVSAKTVNGSVAAALDSVAGSGAVKLETVNGSVTAELPASLDGSLSIETVHGRVSSDFPVAATPDDPRHFIGTIGKGGRTIDLNTVNGSVTLHRGS